MAARLYLNAPANKYGVTTNLSNLNAIASPLANLPDLKWHSDFDYLGVVTTKTGTFNLQVPDSSWTLDAPSGSYSKIIVAHGQSYAPILMGHITIGGVKVPITGDFLATAKYLNRYNIYADATHIRIVAKGVNVRVGGPTGAVNCAYTIHVCNMGVTAAGALVRPAFNSSFSASPTRLVCGRFDTNYGYFNKDAAGDLYIYRGPSLSVEIGAYPGSTSYLTVGTIQRINGYNNTASYSIAAGGYPGTNASFAPTTTRVSLSPAGGSGLILQTGRIRFGNGFDTDKKTFLVPSFVNTSFTIPEMRATGSPINATSTINLGAVNAYATDVMGFFTYSGQTRSIGGTHIRANYSLPMAVTGTYYTYDTGLDVPAVAQTLHFQISSGNQLQAVVRTRIPGTAMFGLLLPAVTCSVKALVGTFDY